MASFRSVEEIELSAGETFKAVILTSKPEITALLYFESFTDKQLQTGDVYEGCHRIHASFGFGMKLEDLKKAIQKRWPEATIYQLPRIGVGAPSVWR